jgi:hypothetical protein
MNPNPSTPSRDTLANNANAAASETPKPVAAPGHDFLAEAALVETHRTSAREDLDWLSDTVDKWDSRMSDRTA